MRKGLIAVAIVFAIPIVLGCHYVYDIGLLSSRRAIENFFKFSAPEAYLMDPLILGGESVVEPLIEMVRTKPDMERKYSAIAFLGNNKIASAEKALIEIVENTQEHASIRGIALRSLHRINPDAAVTCAKRYIGTRDHIDSVSMVLDGHGVFFVERSYKEVLLSYWFEGLW